MISAAQISTRFGTTEGCREREDTTAELRDLLPKADSWQWLVFHGSLFLLSPDEP